MERALNLIKETLSTTFVNLLIPRVSSFCLVGGALRDAYFGVPLKDFDFVVREIDFKIIKNFLKAQKISHFFLNEEQFALLRANANNSTFDFMVLSGSIEEDINKRDFTINSLYYDLRLDQRFFKEEFLHDLQNRVLKVVNSNSIVFDPVRSLRGIRLASDLSLSVENNTKRLISGGVLLLENVTKERVREEVKKILHSDFRKLILVLKDLFGEDLNEVLPRIKLLDRMAMLEKEVNKDISFKELCKASLLSKYFTFFLMGFTGREKKYIDEITDLEIENNFDSMFGAFIKYMREIRIPLCAIVISFCLEDVLKTYSLFDEWSRIKIDGYKIREGALTGKEIGRKKEDLLKDKCREIYDEI